TIDACPARTAMTPRAFIGAPSRSNRSCLPRPHLVESRCHAARPGDRHAFVCFGRPLLVRAACRVRLTHPFSGGRLGASGVCTTPLSMPYRKGACTRDGRFREGRSKLVLACRANSDSVHIDARAELAAHLRPAISVST